MRKLIVTLFVSTLHLFTNGALGSSSTLNVDIAKFNTDTLVIDLEATGDDLISTEVRVVNPKGQVVTFDEEFDPTDSFVKSYTFKPTIIGAYDIRGVVSDLLGNLDRDQKTLGVPNRDPDIPIISLGQIGTGGIEMGSSISLLVSGADPDSNLTSLALEVYGPTQEQTVPSDNDYSPKAVTDFDPTSSSSNAFEYSISYSDYTSFGFYYLRVTAIDEEGASTSSNPISFYPTNPERVKIVKSQNRAEGEKAIWFVDSEIVSESITVERFRDIP